GLRRTAREAPGGTGTPDVWIWADSFTDQLSPHTGQAALALLRAAGLRAEVIPEPACCGLTWVTTGQLDQARRIVGRTVATLSAYVGSGVPVVGLEPSCLATLRSDAEELVDSPEATVVAEGVRTLAEVLTDLADQGRLALPDLSDVEVLVQPHCHQASILGFDADKALLERCGAAVTVVAGCCGLAGNFGMEKGHYETSVAVAETHLLPAVRARGSKVVLADGVSCRVQLDDLEQLRALHLSELLAFGAPADQSTARPSLRTRLRGRRSSRGRR
ncbi:(Fe-S)-binding protein, partial [Nocardioides aquaticus]